MNKQFAPILLGNWKMNLNRDLVKSFFKDFDAKLNKSYLDKTIVGFAPPFTLIETLHNLISDSGLKIKLGSQNISYAEKGAHTGEISAEMLRELCVEFSIIGHSERRAMYGERSELVAKRATQAINNSISAVICVGETEAEYRSAKTKEVVLKQLEESLFDVKNINTKFPSIIIAYEPVWAIGTGLSATPIEAESVCKIIKEFLVNKYSTNIPVLYGGSADQNNITALYSQDSIDGFLIGGASLKPEAFSEMIFKTINVH